MAGADKGGFGEEHADEGEEACEDRDGNRSNIRTANADGNDAHDEWDEAAKQDASPEQIAVLALHHFVDGELDVAATVTDRFHPAERQHRNNATNKRPTHRVGGANVEDCICNEPGGGTSGDGTGEEHRQQQRRLPQVAALALGE